MIATLGEVRRQGFAMGRSQRSPDRITYAVRLPDITVEPVAFGITVPEDDAKADPNAWPELLKQSVHRWLGGGQRQPRDAYNQPR